MAGITGTAAIVGPVNRIFQQTLLRNAKNRCPYFTGSSPADVQEHRGSFTAYWRRIENLTPNITALSELTGAIAFPTRTADAPTVTDFSATLSKYGNYIFLNEEVDLINFSGQMDKLVEVIGINAGQSLNRLQRDVLEDNATAIFAGTATSNALARGKLDINSLRSARNVLDRNAAMMFTARTTGSPMIGTTPIRDAYWGICHADSEIDIRTLTGFSDVSLYAGQTETANGEFGTVNGVRFISSPEGTIDLAGAGTATSFSVIGTDPRGTTSGGVNSFDLYHCLVMGMGAVGSVGLGFEHIKEIYQAGDNLPGVQLLSHDRGSAGAGDPLNEVASLGWKSWHAGQILNANWIRVIRHVATLY